MLPTHHLLWGRLHDLLPGTLRNKCFCRHEVVWSHELGEIILFHLCLSMFLLSTQKPGHYAMVTYGLSWSLSSVSRKKQKTKRNETKRNPKTNKAITPSKPKPKNQPNQNTKWNKRWTNKYKLQYFFLQVSTLMSPLQFWSKNASMVLPCYVIWLPSPDLVARHIKEGMAYILLTAIF